MLISIAVMSAPEARGRVLDHIAALCSGPFRKRYRNLPCPSQKPGTGRGAGSLGEAQVTISLSTPMMGGRWKSPGRRVVFKG